MADDESRLKQSVEPVPGPLVESFDDRSHGSFSLLPGFLAHSGQVDVGELSQHAVVVPGDRNAARNIDARAAQLVEESDAL